MRFSTRPISTKIKLKKDKKETKESEVKYKQSIAIIYNTNKLKK